ncbi:MAG: hypothetical protein HZC54_01635 [Verrucomicrobia bacterium]|nr:hypothetical protein [Verrucomicrobiota bacterium]
MSDSHKAVLHREQATEQAKEFNDLTSLLKEVIDYGTDLIPRAYANSPKDGKAACLIFILLRQCLMHLDGVEILVLAGNASSARLQLRSLWEITILVEWILAKDTDAKIRHFFVANIRRERQRHLIGLPNTPEATKYPDIAKFLSTSEELVRRIPSQIQVLDKLLLQPDLKPVDDKFQEYYTKHGYDKDWFKVYGLPSQSISLRAIAKSISKEFEYTWVYRPFSDDVHASDMWRSIQLGAGNRVWLTPIREPQGIPETVQFAISFTARLYEMILNQYRPNEAADNFKRKKAEWEPRVRKQYHVTVNRRPLHI